MSRLSRFGSSVGGSSIGHYRNNSSSKSEISVDSIPSSPTMSSASGIAAPRGLRKPGAGASGIGGLARPGIKPKRLAMVESHRQTLLGCDVAFDEYRGYLRFLGSTHFKPGTWAGIELDDEGAGKNDGSVAGHVYFTCPPQTGIFVLASKLSAPANNDHGGAPRGGLRGPSAGLRRPSTGAAGIPAPGKPLNFRPESRASRFVGMSAQQYKRRSLMMTDDDDGYRPGTPQAAGTPNRSKAGHDLAALNGGGNEEDGIPNGTNGASFDSAEAQKMQARAEVLEAENRLLRLEVQQGKARLAAGELLERGIVGEAHAMLGRDEEVASLRERVDRLTREKSEVEQERERLRREVTDRKRQSTTSTLAHVEDGEQLLRLTEALAERESRIRELEQTITELTKRVEEAESAAKNATPQEDVESVKALRQRVEELEEAMHETDQMLAQKEDEERELREQLERLMRERDFDDARRSHEGGDVERQQERIRSLERELEEKSAEMGQLSARLDRISTEHEKEKATLEETIKQLRAAGQETIELYESKLQALQQAGKDAMALMDDEGVAERTVLTEQLNAAQDEIQELRMAGAETIEVYEMRVAELKDELTKVQASNGSGSEADAALRLQLEAAREEIRAVQEAAAVRETEMETRLQEAKASGVLSDSQGTIIQLQTDLEAALAERLRLAEQVATLKTQARELKNSRNDLEQRIVEADQVLEQARVNARHSISSMDDIMRDRDAELNMIVKEKLALESEVKQLRQSLEDARHEPVDNEELNALREELEDLRVQLKDANNAKSLSSNATANGDDGAAQSAELQRRIDELTQENREAKQENQRLLEVQASLSEAHRQVESECLKLMDELERLHSEQLSMPPVQSAPEVDAGIKLEEVPDDDPDNPMPPEQRRLLSLLKEKQSALESQQRAHQQEQRRLQQRISELERAHRAEVEQRDKDINDLENLIESKIFREADLEEQLEQQCQLVKQLQQQQQQASSSGYGNELTVDGAQSHGMNSRTSSIGRTGARSPSAASSTGRSRGRPRYHELSSGMGTGAINGTKPPKSPKNRSTIPEEDEAQFDRTYCDNCETFGEHWTEDCPAESEIF
ncbi:hypothetical protein BDF22DRAFT_744568 [Syncephalis plumigaleata]|nr:hypothetical protein BDF22DRAFT_744568 [Syncephalis plumigaleata]